MYKNDVILTPSGTFFETIVTIIFPIVRIKIIINLTLIKTLTQSKWVNKWIMENKLIASKPQNI